jgi:CTP synthase (UTP-ammonia lyase)
VLQVALIGDHDPSITAHRAIPPALALSAAKIGQSVELSWQHTTTLEGRGAGELGRFDGVWCVPGSPYASMSGALDAIRVAREFPIPFLGTCGGFQHAVIEYARDVLGFVRADHGESNPNAALPIIVPLECALVEARGRIKLVPGSITAAACESTEIEEEYHCQYGFNETYRNLLADSPLRLSGADEAGATRVLELAEHPFFVITLFQPERRGLRGEAHPLITAFLAAAANAQAKTKDRVSFPGFGAP